MSLIEAYDGTGHVDRLYDTGEFADGMVYRSIAELTADVLGQQQRNFDAARSVNIPAAGVDFADDQTVELPEHSVADGEALTHGQSITAAAQSGRPFRYKDLWHTKAA